MSTVIPNKEIRQQSFFVANSSDNSEID